MIAAAISDAAHLGHGEPASLAAELGLEVLQREHAVRQALQEHVRRSWRRVVEEHDGSIRLDEAVLQREDLPPVPDRALREQAQLRAGVHDEAPGLDPRDLGEDGIHPLSELHLGRVEQRVLVLFGEPRRLEDGDPAEIPAVRRRDGVNLFARLRERDVEPPLPLPGPLEQELEGERRLPCSRAALDEVHAPARKPSSQDLVESANARLRPCRTCRVRHEDPLSWSSDIHRICRRGPDVGVPRPRTPSGLVLDARAGSLPTSAGQE